MADIWTQGSLAALLLAQNERLGEHSPAAPSLFPQHLAREVALHSRSLLVSAGFDDFVRLWSSSNSKPVAELSHGSPCVAACQLGPSGFVSASASCSLKLWDARAERLVAEHAGNSRRHRGLFCLETLYLHDAPLVLFGKSNGRVSAWDPRADPATSPAFKTPASLSREGVASLRASSSSSFGDCVFWSASGTRAVSWDARVVARGCSELLFDGLPGVAGIELPTGPGEGGHSVAVVCRDESVWVWPDNRVAVPGRVGLKDRDVSLLSCALLPESSTVVGGFWSSLTASVDVAGDARWSSKCSTVERRRTHSPGVWSVACSSSGTCFMGHSDGTISAVRRAKGSTGGWELATVWQAHTSFVESLLVIND
eukprot:m51a1_g3945 hypothetical protein (369) ;mRNA; r:301261-302367